MTNPTHNAAIDGLFNHDEFIARHIGINPAAEATMLAAIGANSLDHLVETTLPRNILMDQALNLPTPQTEAAALAALKKIAQQNVIHQSFIGLGYYPVLTPNVIVRNVLENPGWYTAYTPYQAEISQGRLEALLNYQQMVIDLTGLDMANASLLDEATAAAEAMAMSHRVSGGRQHVYFVDERVLPQTLDVLRTRATYFEFELKVGLIDEALTTDCFGVLYQQIGEAGDVRDDQATLLALKAKGVIVSMACDIMASVLMKSAATMGADIAFGNSQRFGVPMGFGGPHAAFFAFRDAMKRFAPGRIIGVSKDKKGKMALRMALQTREQHIRREKANSNICTSQVLLANIAGMYAVYHGPVGLKAIAQRIHGLANAFAAQLLKANYQLKHHAWFDTIQVDAGSAAANIYKKALAAGYNLRWVNETTLGVAFHEAVTQDDYAQLCAIFGLEHSDASSEARLPTSVLRDTPILTHPVFNTHHSEHQMLRYLKKLESRDLAMNHSMISLGSCTMKLNATAEMIPITWPEFAQMHPFAPKDQTQGYLTLIQGLSEQLKAITGFDDISMQPNSGAQGEYAGLLAIRRYHASRGESHRTVCLIPHSAHGTNPATAQMLGMQVVVVKCDEAGNVDVAHLRELAEQHAATLGALMVTYPSTHGVFEAAIKEICQITHDHGGQVYMDGANLNAQVGLCRPADIGADVSHMNLHKTFCIPHGGGGPGVGPIGLKAHLLPFMANHAVQAVYNADPHAHQTAISAAPYGSASILPISYIYIAMMGATGLKRATQIALLNANYMATALADTFPVLYRSEQGRVAHECIIDLRPLKASVGITEVDVAKRLMDYGFHAPTMSFPVAGTLMIEPTESEDKAEMDRFIATMKAIRAEIDAVAQGVWPLNNNPLVNAPHSKADVMDEWDRPYDRQTAFFPLPHVMEHKFWPSVNRIDDVYGDKNLMCSCPSIDQYA